MSRRNSVVDDDAPKGKLNKEEKLLDIILLLTWLSSFAGKLDINPNQVYKNIFKKVYIKILAPSHKKPNLVF